MCPQKHRVFIGPYVAGPAAPMRSPREPRKQGWSLLRDVVRQTCHDLLPSHQRPQSRQLFALQMLAAAALLASVAAGITGAGSVVVGLLIGSVALLAASAFVCGLISTVGQRRYDRRLLRAANDAEPLAFRLLGYRAPGYAGLCRRGSRAAGNDSALGQCWRLEALASDGLQAGDVILVEAGQVIPADGTILEGTATVDESVVTGQSAPVIREHGYVEHVMRGTAVLKGRIVVEVAAKRGHPLDWSTPPPQSSLRAQ